MIRASIFEKFASMANLISTNYVFLLVLIAFIFLSLVLFNTTKFDTKKTKIGYIASYAVIILVLFIKYKNEIFNLFDSLMNNLFLMICFPSITVYILMIIALNVMLIKTVFKETIKNYNKIFNITIYSFVHFNLVLILSTVVKNKLDVSSDLSLYTNETVLNLIDLSIGAFILYLIVNFLFNFIEKKTATKEVKAAIPVTADNKVRITKEESKPKEIEATDDYVFRGNRVEIPKYQCELIYKNLRENSKTYNNNVIKEEIKPKEKTVKNSLTASDYKKFRTMLMQLTEGK
jgi:hypothetical protein